MNERCRHNLVICSRCVQVTDAARRMSDTINGVITFSRAWEICNSWMAFRLADGTSDGVIYDTRQAAISHQSDERLCAYFCFRSAMGGTKPLDCQIFLNMHRHAYDNGGGLSEPQAPQLIMPSNYYDFIRGRYRG